MIIICGSIFARAVNGSKKIFRETLFVAAVVVVVA